MKQGKTNSRITLPPADGLEKLDIPVLDRHTRLIYHPLSGILYRKRFRMVLGYLEEGKKTVLEAGIGRGLLLPELSRRCGRLCGIDLHPRLDVVETMLKNQGRDNVSLAQASITQLPYKDKMFDAIICISVLEHFPDPGECLREFWRVLKNSGQLLLGFPVKNRLTDFLFKTLGCDADTIHPGSHRRIIAASAGLFELEESRVYPGFLARDWSLYFAGKFIKR